MDEVNATQVQKKLNWKIIAAIVVVLAVIIVIVLGAGKGKTAPIKLMEKYYNAKNVRIERMVDDMLAGSDGGKCSKLIKLMRKSESLNDEIEEYEEEFADVRENKVDMYGKNYKVRIKNNKKDEQRLESKELRAYRDSIRKSGENLYDLGKEIEKLDSDERLDIANELDMSVKDVKAIGKCLKKLGEKYKKADVSKGYRMSVTTITTGSELDEPIEEEDDIVVLKVNGKWTGEYAFDLLDSWSYMLNYSF